MKNFANESAQPGRTGLGHSFANGGKLSARGRYSSNRSPWVEVGPDETVLVADLWGSLSESAKGRSLTEGDRFAYCGISYVVIRRSADHGAVGRELSYAPVNW